jgi:chitinase
LTHINYAFLPQPNADGSIQAVPNAGKLQTIVSNAHARGVKVLISVGGWTDLANGGFEGTASTAANRTRFANAMVGLVTQYNLDGVDIDWEYPQPGTAQAANYTAMMTELGNAMHSRGKLLTAAVVALGGTGAGVETAVFNVVDFLNLMAYDGGSGPTHSPYSYAVDSINYWRGRGLPAAKTVLGVPYYARPSWAAYATKVGQSATNACRDTDGSDYWNGIPTMRQKGQLARANGGIMTWELSQDTVGGNSLLTAMWEAVTGRAGSFVCN